ncbi:hypothetical protein B0H14DRAFT_2330907 [Mycena olivaceomarginata]|nr:hypothetical protein B0H14DRAFT_2330907 [Mycena olivaceomarginata]
MAQMARDYHNSIQEKDVGDEYGRVMATEITLEKCDVHLSEAEYKEMDKELYIEDLEGALKLSHNGKAPGIDGLPYEFYKILDILFRQSKGTDNETFNIMGFLKDLYRDIEKFGIVASSKFNTGWMCPIFKKGDKALITTDQ